jgi:hypothetical protein
MLFRFLGLSAAPARVALAVALLASACGGKVTVHATGDGGPPLADAAPVQDALPPPVDSPKAPDTSPPPGPATCAGICAHFANDGCPQPTCVSDCEQLGIDCAASGYETTFQALLQCAVTAEPIVCVNGVPHSPACAALTDKVAMGCMPQGDSGVDIGCSQATSGVACMQCCQMAHPDGAAKYLSLLVSCECVAPAPCASACASELCAQPMVYQSPGDACDTCVSPSLAVGGTCWYQTTNQCGQDPACQAMAGCLATWCASKP